MRQASIQIRSTDAPVKEYSAPRLVKLNFSPEQLARTESAVDRQAELAEVYREVSGDEILRGM